MIRTAILVLTGVVAWLLAQSCDGRPEPRGLDAPASAFSAARADALLARILGPELPHPVSSDEAAAVRARIQQELAGLGVATTVHEGVGCFYRPIFAAVQCGTVKNIIADVVPGQGRAIVMLAHYDSVPAGPGAADDASGVAAIIETVRALKARATTSQHPVLAVITDGEEAGLLGADALLRTPEFRARVGAVVNVEARGNTGPSLLFQTSPGDSPLIDLYKQSADTVATSSLFAVIYELLPNDTDLTPFVAAKIPGFNFAFSGNLAHYHTPLDRRVNLDRSTLQHQGDNLLGVVSSLQRTKLETLSGGSNDVYVPLFGLVLLRTSGGLALAMALVSFGLLLVTLVVSRGGAGGIGAWVRAMAIVPLMLIGCLALGFGIHVVASMVSGQADPSYAHPASLRLGLSAGVIAVFVCCTRLGDVRRSALAIWLWMGLLGILTAIAVPGISPYFVFPTLVASVLLLTQTRVADPWTGRIAQIALAGTAVLPVALWISLAAVGETVQGLSLHPLFTVPAAFGMMTLIPLTAGTAPGTLMGPLSKRAWRYAAAAAVVLALLLGVVQGTRPTYSAMVPQRLSIGLLEDHAAGEARWIAATDAPLPAAVRAAAPFSASRVGEAAIYGIYGRPVYVAPAGKPRLVPPVVSVTSQPTQGGRTVTLSVQASDETSQVMIEVPQIAAIRSVTVNGTRQDISQGTAPFSIWCMTRDCKTATITLDVGTIAFDATVAAVQFGLPADGQKIAAARASSAVPSNTGDITVVSTKIRVP